MDQEESYMLMIGPLISKLQAMESNHANQQPRMDSNSLCT